MIHGEDYTPEALAAARDEIQKRNIDYLASKIKLQSEQDIKLLEIKKRHNIAHFMKIFMCSAIKASIVISAILVGLNFLEVDNFRPAQQPVGKVILISFFWGAWRTYRENLEIENKEHEHKSAA